MPATTDRPTTEPPSPRPPSSQPLPPLRLHVAARSDTGRERSNNEDSFLVTGVAADRRPAIQSERVDVTDDGFAALAVCDGMGGAHAGEVASHRAVEIIDEVLARGGPVASPSDLGHRLITSIVEASKRIHAEASTQRSLAGMGTTATACALRGEDLLVAQVGDSRAYLFRRGRLTQLTRDQTLAMLLLERGQLAPEELATFDYRNVILQAVGTADRVEVDLTHVAVRRGDVLLVCSDGLHGAIDEAAIRDVLARDAPPEVAAEALITLANEAGGPDNVTCVIAKIDGGALSAADDEVIPEKAHLADPTSPIAPPPIDDPDDAPVETPRLGGLRSAFARFVALFRGSSPRREM